jgi:hypothetical protein
LPVPNRGDYGEKPKSNVIASQPDAGAQKTRRRFTATPRGISFSLQLSSEQADTFDSFFHADCKDGSLTFTMTSPRTGATLNCRFAVGYTPELKSLAGDHWSVDVSLEALP